MATPPPPGGPSLAALNTERDISQGAETESSLSTPSHFTSKEALGTESRPVSRERQPPPPESHEAGSPLTDEEGLSHQMEQTTIEQNQNTQDIAEPSTTTPTSPPVLESAESQATEEAAPLESFRDPSPPADVRSNTIPQEGEETAESTSLPASSSTQPAASHSGSERTARNRSPSPVIPRDLSDHPTIEPGFLQQASISQPELYSVTPGASDDEHSTEDSVDISPAPAGLPQPPRGNDSPYLRQRMGSFPSVEAQQSHTTMGSHSSRQSSNHSQAYERPGPPEFQLPRWQPDAEVTYCPICNSQFSIFVRKHHCRKCGRVVCNSCSPHRIMIPHQYIVRPPGYEMPLPQSLLVDSFGAAYFDSNGMSGGERVRLCNPCVPDPNTAPPRSPEVPSPLSPRSAAHQRSRSSIGDAYGPAPQPNRYSALVGPSSQMDPSRLYAPRTRSITVDSRSSSGSGSRHRASVAHQSPLDRLLSGASSSAYSTSYPARHASHGEHPASSRRRVRQPVPQIPEEDECPVCHRELPSRNLENFEDLRESHITSCIESHSTYASPRRPSGGEMARAAQRRTGMYTYAATEKDCVDDAECTICLEEFSVGVQMARLECLCRFHRSCITAWFVNHPGRCPVHQHDGFGY